MPCTGPPRQHNRHVLSKPFFLGQSTTPARPPGLCLAVIAGPPELRPLTSSTDSATASVW